MPKVYLTAQARAEAAEMKQNEAFTMAVKTVRARTNQSYATVAETVGMDRSTLWKLTQPEFVGRAQFGRIRAVAHAVKMTKEEWLRLGGF
ncbi:MAG TPA: hypothetical protein IAA83_05510 [Candidatus Avoscillospira avistercoris]|uniref:Uncharacterized protein n=1 Tax=Candidatus Avoscillospira avistercoris TaxID=2840707 RepID=A0A9D1F9J6_9FIRM|nr:hypothetical protein [Candidatus Avoscillospira avistercoris]